MSGILRCISPIDGSLVAERPLATAADAARAVDVARRAQAGWRAVPLAQRMAICAAFAEHMVAGKDRLGRDLTRQMGRPIRYTPGEIAAGASSTIRRVRSARPPAISPGV